MIDRARLIAPRESLGVLIAPDAGVIRTWLRTPDSARFAGARLLDAPLQELRAALRRRLECEAPLVVTGHQAEFIHAGVFAKNVAAEALAAECGAATRFVSVDADVPKSNQLAVPQATAHGLRRVALEIPGCDLTRGFEFQPAAPRRHWLDFFVRLATLRGEEHYPDTLLKPFADAWLDAPEGPLDYGDALSRASAASDAALGLRPMREIRVSGLAAAPEYRVFVAHLLVRAAEFREAYNAAQRAYQGRYRIRAPGRPVPRLAAEGGRVETPFWIVRVGGSRHRLFVAEAGDGLTLFADGEPVATIGRAQFATAEAAGAPWPIESAGWRIRPRALTLSAFIRLLLADVFVHGIGGAKYDEITGEFLRGFFGVPAAPLACVSATLHLDLPRSPVGPDALSAARRRSRDVRFNPQRYLERLPAEAIQRRAALIAESDRLRAVHSRDRARRRQVFQGIRGANEALLAADPWRAAALDQHVQELEQQSALDRVALDREYFYALHRRTALEELIATLRARLRA